jgi:Protein of unknown function DUF262/Protein of unknown function (DUF1524)
MTTQKMSGTDIKLDGIGHVLADRALRVPVYQRPFSWKADQIKELLSDLRGAIGRKDDEYFLGSIVLTASSEEARPSVVDGQQRLAAVAMIYGAIRDYFSGQADERDSEIARTYLVSTVLRSRETEPRLRLNEVDDDFFRKHVLSPLGSPDRSARGSTDSHRRIAEAFAAICQEINGVATSAPRDPLTTLLDWIEYLHSKVHVIVVEVPDEANAFLIFETLNDRGLDLSIADLLKNYIFGQSRDRLDTARSNWLRATAALEGLGGAELVTTFIRHFWSSKHGYVREKELYRSMKGRVATKQTAIDFTAELAENARLYAALLNSDHEFWGGYGTEPKQHVATLIKLRVEQYRPLLLACLQMFSTEEIKKALRLLVSWNVRLLITGGVGSGTMESRYSLVAKNVRDGKVKTAAQLSKAMADFIPGDEAFRGQFAVARVSQNFLARYYLLALERQMGGEQHPELVPNAAEEDVNLEHILPQKPDTKWPAFNEETAKAYYRRIGNLTLMKSSDNAQLGNKSFATKKRLYGRSSLRITQALAEYNDWDATAIDDRQRELAELGVQTWTLKPQ